MLKKLLIISWILLCWMGCQWQNVVAATELSVSEKGITMISEGQPEIKNGYPGYCWLTESVTIVNHGQSKALTLVMVATQADFVSEELQATVIIRQGTVVEEYVLESMGKGIPLDFQAGDVVYLSVVFDISDKLGNEKQTKSGSFKYQVFLEERVGSGKTLKDCLPQTSDLSNYGKLLVGLWLLFWVLYGVIYQKKEDRKP